MSAEGSESLVINAPAASIMEAISGVESYPQWMDEFRHAKVLEADGAGRPVRAEFEVDAKLQMLRYTLAYEYSDGQVSWESIAGDLKRIQGSYRLEEAPGGTNVTYQYLIDPGFPVPGFVMKKAVNLLVSKALYGLKERVEGLRA